METQVMAVEEKEFLQKEVEPVIQMARQVVVNSDADRACAESLIDHWNNKMEMIEERFHPESNKKKAYDLYTASLETVKAFYEPFKTAKKIVTDTVKGWDRREALRVQEEQERARREREEKERKAREEIEAKARAERIRAAEAEQKRKESEERANAARIEADEAKEKAAQAAVDGDATAKKIAEGNARAKESEVKIETQNAAQHAAVAEQSVENAAVLQDQAESVQVETKFTPPPTPVKKLIWKARVVSLKIVCRSIGEGLLPFTLVEIKPSILNELGKNYDGKTRIPGIEMYQDVSSRV